MGKSIIKKETWMKVFSSKFYQDFIKEWLGLYDAYIKTNPNPPKILHIECIDKIIQFFEDLKKGLNDA